MLDKIKNYIFHKDKIVRSNRWIFFTILITSVICLVAALILSIEVVQLAKNPNVHLNCSVNVVINCVTVANSKYAALFGFPNSFIGLIGEPIFIVIAIAMLMGAKLPKKFMFGAQIALLAALTFSYVLFYISSFLIHALCPWCMTVMLATTIMFVALTRYNIRENNLFLSKKVSKVANNFIEKDYDKFTLATVIVLVIAFLIIRYGADLFA